MDLVPPIDYAVSSSRYNKALHVHHRQLEKANSQFQFVTTCLRRNIIPWGLRIPIQPLVPKPPCQKLLRELSKQWRRIAWQASIQFLVTLKHYRGRCIQVFRQHLSNIHNRAKADLGETNFIVISHKVEAASSKFGKHQLRRRNRKLKKLLALPKERKRRQRFRPFMSIAQETKFVDDVDKYFTCLPLKEFFADQYEAENSEQDHFRPPPPPSKWTPPKE